MKRVKQLAALVMAAVMVLCTGCGSDPEVAKGLEIRAAFLEEPSTLDPAYAVSDVERTIVVHLFENLLKNSESGVVPGQAEKYEHVVNEDGTETYTFTLRDNLRWSDGVPVTAQDYVYAWQRLVAPQIASPNREILRVVAGYEEAAAGDMMALQVSAPDNKTFTVTLRERCAYFLSVICTDSATMPLRSDIVPNWMATGEVDENGEEIVFDPTAVVDWTMEKGTMVNNGAYAIRNFNAGHLTVVEREGYYDSRRIGPKEIDFFFAGSLDRAVSGYDKGEIDFIFDCGQMEGSVAAQHPEVMVLVVNQMSSLSEPVRQALTLSLDRNAVAAAAGNRFSAVEGLVPEGVTTLSGKQFRQVNGPVLPCDEESIEKNMLYAAGLIGEINRGGVPVMDRLGVISLVYEASTINSSVAQQVQKQWKERLGVVATPVPVQVEGMQKTLASGAFTIALMNVSDVSNTARAYLDHYVSDSPDNYGQHYSNAYDILLRAAAASDSVEARDAYLADAERLLLESGYVIPLCTGSYRYLLRSTLTGLLHQDMGVYNFSAVTEIPVA